MRIVTCGGISSYEEHVTRTVYIVMWNMLYVWGYILL